MAKKHIAALGALLIAATPGLAFEPREAVGNTTMFYVSVPLDGLSRKQKELVWGMQLQGKHEYQSVNLDSRLLNFMGMEAATVKWVAAGVVAVGAAAAVARKDKRTQNSYDQAQQQQADSGTVKPPVPCDQPVVPSC
jgi:hypothetical protein